MKTQTPAELLTANWRAVLDYLDVVHDLTLTTDPPENWEGDGFFITAEDCHSEEPDNVERLAQVGLALMENGFFRKWDITDTPLWVDLWKSRLFLSEFEKTGRYAI
jgi:hypothetical protein